MVGGRWPIAALASLYGPRSIAPALVRGQRRSRGPLPRSRTAGAEPWARPRRALRPIRACPIWLRVVTRAPPPAPDGGWTGASRLSPRPSRFPRHTEHSLGNKRPLYLLR